MKDILEVTTYNPETCVEIPVQTLPREEVLAIFYGKDYKEEQEQNKDKVTHVLIDLNPAEVDATADTDKAEYIEALETKLAEQEKEAESLRAKVTEARAFNNLVNVAKDKGINLVDNKGKVSDELHATFFSKRGMQQSAEIIFNKYKNQIKNFARDKAPNQLHCDEIAGEMMIALTKCLKNFDISTGYKFKTVLWKYAQNTKLGYYNHLNCKKRVSESGTPDLSINDKINNCDFTISDAIADDTAESKERSVILREVINKQLRPLLDAKENKMIDLLLVGFEKGELAKPLNITRAGVYNRIKCIREKLLKVLTREQVRELMSMTT